jgi:hypothetical protein
LFYRFDVYRQKVVFVLKILMQRAILLHRAKTADVMSVRWWIVEKCH